MYYFYTPAARGRTKCSKQPRGEVLQYNESLQSAVTRNGKDASLLTARCSGFCVQSAGFRIQMIRIASGARAART